jgi:hypothetical protein
VPAIACLLVALYAAALRVCRERRRRSTNQPADKAQQRPLRAARCRRLGARAHRMATGLRRYGSTFGPAKMARTAPRAPSRLRSSSCPCPTWRHRPSPARRAGRRPVMWWRYADVRPKTPLHSLGSPGCSARDTPPGHAGRSGSVLDPVRSRLRRSRSVEICVARRARGAAGSRCRRAVGGRRPRRLIPSSRTRRADPGTLAPTFCAVRPRTLPRAGRSRTRSCGAPLFGVP